MSFRLSQAGAPAAGAVGYLVLDGKAELSQECPMKRRDPNKWLKSSKGYIANSETTFLLQRFPKTGSV